MAQIGRVATVDADTVARARHEVQYVVRRWVVQYGEYQSGGWWTVSLLNESGDPEDVLIRDCQPTPTSLLLRMPQMHRLLDGLGLQFMWARLGRLESNSFLWEHRDYAELSTADRYRLHIPLSTNSSAYLVVGGYRVHLALGWIWRLVPTYSHGVCNLFGPDRIHLIIDCYADHQFEHVASNASLTDSDFRSLPTLGALDLDRHTAVARQLLQMGYRRAAEMHLLRLFFYYALPAGRVYDLLIELYLSLSLQDAATSWLTRKAALMASRDDG